MAQIEALEKLASTGLLKQEPPGREEIAGLLHTAAIRLEDSRKTTKCAGEPFRSGVQRGSRVRARLPALPRVPHR